MPKLGVDLPPAAREPIAQLWATLTAESSRDPRVPKALEALVVSLTTSIPGSPAGTIEPSPSTEAERLRELAAKLQADIGEPPSLEAMVRLGRGPQYQVARKAWMDRLRVVRAFKATAAALEQA